MSTIPFTELVQRLPATVPFVGPETLERRRGQVFKARIGANESAFGISPQTARAMRNAVDSVCWYGDPENFELRTAIAARHDVAIDEVCVDAGIDSLLGLSVRMLINPGTPVVTSHGAYPTFNYHVNGFGGKLCAQPYCNDHEDPQALLAAVNSQNAPLVYLANPDNPMGSWHDAGTIQQFIDSLPATTVLLLDEAYHEFAPPGTSPAIDTGDPRVIRLRTFSKAYGMAGARVGYAIAHRDLITGFNKIRNHFGVNRIAQSGALAALHDQGFVTEVANSVAAGRQQLYDFAASLGIRALPSATNFVAFDLESETRAKAMLDKLLGADVFIRMPGVAPQNRCIRVGVGTQAEYALFAEQFAQIWRQL